MKEIGSLRLSPLNPFTPRQREVLESILEGKSSTYEIGRALSISRNTVKMHIYGQNSQNINLTPCQLGILGTIERAYGIRPYKLGGIIGILTEDVVFPEIKPPQ